MFGKIKESYLLFYKSSGAEEPPNSPPSASAAYANQFQMKGPSQLFSLNRCCHRVHRILLAKKSCPDYSHVSCGLIFSSVRFLLVLVLLSYIIIPKPERKKNWIYSLNKGQNCTHCALWYGGTIWLSGVQFCCKHTSDEQKATIVRKGSPILQILLEDTKFC